MHCLMASSRRCPRPLPHAHVVQVSVLGSLQGYLLTLGLATWDQFQDLALKPQARSTGWRHLSLLYRRLAMCLASDALAVRCSWRCCLSQHGS